MAQITSSVGLISGIDTGNLINELVSLDSGPLNILQTSVSSAQNMEQTYGSLETQLQGMQQIGSQLALPQTFQNSTSTSSNPNVLSATTSVGAAVGTYTFQVARLVTTQQSISSGFTDTDTTPVGAGNITLELGGGLASSQTALSQLNGGAGIPSGEFRITDRSGNTAIINTANDVNLDDVVSQINTATGINVHATLTDSGIVLTDETGETASNLTVQDLNGGTTAASLGIAGSVASNTLTGSDINYLSSSTPLSQLNDGNGISTTTAGQTDFTVTLSNGSAVNVSLNGAQTIGDVLNDINTAGGGKLTAAISSGENGITLTDSSGGTGTMTIAQENGSTAAANLGLMTAAAGNTITGQPILAGLDSVLVSSLNGGSGLALGTLTATDSSGVTGNFNLAGARSFSDVINDINTQAKAQGVGITASMNAAGTGLELTNTAAGAGSLVVADNASSEALKINGTFSGTAQGGNLQAQYVTDNTQLSTYDGGAGVEPGIFQITNSAGQTATVDMTTGTFNTIGDVIRAINAKDIDVTASINSTGNGIQLTDTAGGTGELTVTDEQGTAAASLNIAGNSTGTGANNVINGALQKTIAISDTDTLSDVENAINQLGFGVTADIINDGSASNPYRLSLTAVNSGQAGQVVIDGGTTGLNFSTLVSAQDAAVFYGGDDSSQPLLITSSTNQLSNVIKGTVVSLTGAGSGPVTLTISPDPTSLTQSLQTFVTDFNTLVTAIGTDSAFNTTTNQGGILLGDSTAQTIQETVYSMINSVVQGTGPYQDLADMGITVNTSDTTGPATLSFDQSTFESAFASNPTAVQNLFSQATTGLGNVINNAMDSLVDPVNGVVTLKDNTLSTQIQNYQTQITQQNAILAEQRQQLQNEFNNMEETLASLQSQQQVLNSFKSSSSSSTSSSADSNLSSLGSTSSSGSSS